MNKQKLIPYDYQEEAVNAIFSYLKLTKDKPLESNPLAQLPTGSGKSLIQALCIERILGIRPLARILCLCHTTDIIDQNYEEFISYSHHKDVGIYCGNLKRKDNNAILFSSIQSAAKSKLKDGFFDIVFIDEAHLCNNKEQGQYREFINKLQKTNPKLRIIGLTATPWRMDGGCLIHGDDRLFSAIVYQIPLKLLIEKGRLVPVVTPSQDILIKPDLSELVYSNSTKDYTIKSQTSIVEKKLEECTKEAVGIFENRKHILSFCPSIKICNALKKELKRLGVTAELYIGSTTKKKRKEYKDKFESGKIKYLLSVGATTTGFNSKCVDGLLCFRITDSSSLWVQILGRGMRIFPGKIDCLLVDYGGNVDRHGPVEDIESPPVKTKKGDGIFEMVKVCPQCNMDIHMAMKTCKFCGYEYPIIERRYKPLATGKDVLFSNSNEKEIEEFEVCDTEYSLYEKHDGSKSIKISYFCSFGSKIINRFMKITPERGGYFIESMVSEIIQIFHRVMLGDVDFFLRDGIVDSLTKLIKACEIEEFFNQLMFSVKDIGFRYNMNYKKILMPSKIKAIKNEKYHIVTNCYYD